MPFDALGFGPSQPSDAQLLLDAQRLISQPWHWTKHTFIGFSPTLTGPYGRGGILRCAVAALAAACDNDDYRHPTSRERKLARLLVNEMPRYGGLLRLMLNARSRLVFFNDATRTSHADVMALFDRAIARCHKREMQQYAAG